MVTYGFYDSINHDRRYNAIQFGSIFDGIINDGVYMSIGTCFRVIPWNPEDMLVLVGVGRAWFNHTWTYNDSPLPIIIPQSELLLDRIDAIVIDVKQNREDRKNEIILVKGTPSNNPERPTLIDDADRHQYPLAYIYVRAETTEIHLADITNVVGTSKTPYVTGILETVGIDALLDQWGDQWTRWFEGETTKDENEWDAWFNNYKNLMEDWKTNEQNEFIQWFETLQYILDGDLGAKLTLDVLKLREDVDTLNEFKDDLLYRHAIYDSVSDNSSEYILDSNGNQIGSKIVFKIKENR